jgi:hypothetical protein
MKKIISFIAAAFIVSAAFAQTAPEQDYAAAIKLLDQAAAKAVKQRDSLLQVITKLSNQPATIAPVIDNLTVKPFSADLNTLGSLSAYNAGGMLINQNLIKIVSDPVYGAKRKVMQLDVKPTDTGGVTENARAQVQTPMQYVEGQTLFVGQSVRFTAPIWTYFLTFSEVYGAPYKGTSPFRLTLQASNIVFMANDTKTETPLYTEALKANVWYDIVYMDALSKTHGKVYAWIRRQGETVWQQVVKNDDIITITSANADGPQYHKLACYYDKTHTYTDATKKTIVTSVRMYLANHKIGSSFDAVAPDLLN